MNNITQTAEILTEAESWGDVVDMRECWNDDPSFGMSAANYAAPYTTIDDRADGKFLPVYRTEQDLAKIRAVARRLSGISGKYLGVMEALANYTLGNGFDFSIQCDSPDLRAVLQWSIDELMGRWNFLSGLDRELHDRSREDGEALIALECGRDRWPTPLVIEPDCLTEPGNARQIEDWLDDCEHVQSWSFGVRTPARNTANVLGYHVTFDSGGRDWEYFCENHLQFLKRGVPRNAKRGVSDWYSVAGDLAREAKLSRNMGVSGAMQAAVAWILQSPTGTTAAQISNLTLGGASGQFQRPANGGGTQTTYRKHYPPGSILTPTPGIEYQPGPMGAERNAGFIEVAQHLLRSVGVRWNMPEYMISGDASNGNYASTLVAESPFVKARESDQQFYSRHFKELIWKALRMLWEKGILKIPFSWEELRRAVEIKVECPNVASTDPKVMADVASAYVGMGVMSKRTAATKAGLDFDQELADGAKEDAPPPAPVIGGIPGQPVAGQPVPVKPPAKPPIQAAVEAALESVTSTHEARVILGQLAESDTHG